MAVMQNSIIFGGIDSADFGIYIGGEGTFDAPKRDVEMISIPGRNGAFALDKGRFENIEVTYSAFNHEPDLATFSAQLEGFRNAICSQKGYQRLTDTFHPDEYRMAAYIDGLEIKPIEYNTAATFDIKFNCKPQRYLTSGEEAIDVDSGDVVTNPTLFESSPMLEVKGYGNIVIGGEEIAVAQGEAYGEILICSKLGREQTLDTSLLASGDAIYPKDSPNSQVTLELRNSYDTLASISLVDAINCTTEVTNRASNGAVLNVYPTVEFAYGTASSVTASATCSIRIRSSGGTSASYTATMSVTIAYDGDNTLTMTTNNSFSIPNTRITSGGQMRSWYGNSSVTILGNPIYIDLDIGEAWNEDTGTPVSINNAVTLGAELPVLAVGETEITFDNTITDLKVVPRWWRI